MNRGQLAHERSENRARREPVAFVSINQIAEPATLHSDQPFLFAEPPDNILLPPLSLPSLPSGAYRLTLRVRRLSSRNRRRVDAYSWKRETKANRKSRRTPKQAMLESTHEGRYTSQCESAYMASRENKYNKDCEPIGHAHHNERNDAQTPRQI